jgi:hypothetical protein
MLLNVSPSLWTLIESPGRRVARQAQGVGLFTRYRRWIARRTDAQRMRELEPRLARDVGLPPGQDRPPEGYLVDPRPLWGIGLTPQPLDIVPPWSNRLERR